MISNKDAKKILFGLSQEWDDLSKRRAALEDYIFDPSRGAPDEDDYEVPNFSEENFYAAINRFKSLLEVVYESLSLGESKRQLESALAKQSNAGKFEFVSIPDFDTVHCPAVDILKNYFDALKLCFGDEKPHQLVMLERILKNGGYHVSQYTKRESRNPSSEDDVQKAMDEVLKAAFDDFIPKPSISKPIKGFEPDGSIKSVKALIEYKFSSSREELKKAVDEIFADSVGYFSDEEWKNFFVVLYLTDHFDRVSAIEAQIKNSCSHVDNLEVIVITGQGSRSEKPNADSKKTTKKLSNKRKKRKSVNKKQ